jgi:hypothetical protein
MIELLRNADVVGRQRPVVTVRDFSSLATCYAELSGRVRPEADIAVVVAGLRFQALPLFNKEAWWTLIN